MVLVKSNSGSGLKQRSVTKHDSLNNSHVNVYKKDTNIRNDCQLEHPDNINHSNVDSDVKNNVKDNVQKARTLQIPSPDDQLTVNFQLNIVVLLMFLVAFGFRIYELDKPASIVFDELHYGRFVSLYLRRTFFFDSQPPLGKQLISLSAYLSGYNGNYANNFTTIGQEYDPSMPVRALRFVPSLCGALLVPIIYYIVVELGFSQKTATFTSLLIVFENSLLTQSRFILLDTILMFFSFFGILAFLIAQKKPVFTVSWFCWILFSGFLLTCGICVKYIGIFTLFQIQLIAFFNVYWKIADKSIKTIHLWLEFVSYVFSHIILPIVVYFLIFYIHLSILIKAGPHDNIMTSAFQASLEGGLASIIRGQPREIAHGSQITLRNTHGRTCWLHSHQALYPIRYPDKRGSSHQQQVTCYSFKDVNNWWIVKRPNVDELITHEPRDNIKNGDIIQLVHGLSGRALNSHDIAAPMSPYNQEVSCYIDYNISMLAQNFWQIKLLNPDDTDNYWHAINSRVQLIHVNSTQALKLSGLQLPDWGYHQHEVVTDKQLTHPNTIWNVEEHRYTKNSDEKELERELGMAEFVPLNPTYLSFWDKMIELQYKMLVVNPENVQNHMYSTDSPFDWVFLQKGIAYWLSPTSNAQIYLIGNIVTWYLGNLSIFIYCALLFFYILRRKRFYNDLSDDKWIQFNLIGQLIAAGYFLHFLPYFLSERTLFLHHYLPAVIFKIILTATILSHIGLFVPKKFMLAIYTAIFGAILYTFWTFLPLSYGITELSAADVLSLKWKKTWHLLIHKN